MTQPRPIDADNHYYEALDAFTRYQDKAMRTRGVQIMNEGKRVNVVIGGRVNRFIANPTFDPVIVPGSIDLFFRGQVPEGVDPKSLAQIEPIHPEYQDRDKRIEVMDQQGLAAAILFPTQACGVEEALRNDPEATASTLSAFNRWLDEDWGFNYKDRIFSAPMISLADVDAAVRELDYLLKAGTRVVHVRPAPVPGDDGPRSLGDPLHDPVWAKLAEAGVPVAFHLGDSGYTRYAAAWGGNENFEPFVGKPDPLSQLIVADRAIHDTMASLIVHGVFTRHPKLRVAVDRERLGLGFDPAQAAAQKGQSDARILPRCAARRIARACLGRSLLRGGHSRACRPDRPQSRAVRIGLAARRRACRSGRIC